MEFTLIITLKEILIAFGISGIIGLILGIILYYNGYDLD
jgi:ABC-type nitrate/sulfonate/bicarbonate transport system permease component